MCDTNHRRLVEVREGVLQKNDEMAHELRHRFLDSGVYVVNLVSSPGAGKTTLLERTLAAYRALELDDRAPLRRALARLLSFADRPEGLAWTERLIATAPDARLAEVTGMLASGAAALRPA